ncbi:helix-turn-helix domain-containing protein [Qipengyuania qiaonensis]|uniref:Helix-turn-helix domain-containing protein n=1 Tax=Qipengyuania qiaonensis TaxID=2867240 RepID=A0ABS7J7W4_9SPHN|nr:helix-turn-helix transcriptional regulator [Qipengyuania qiaonensis]MBX7481723.1 helix-turn-helix domain-containing protein [Qipengyuania qiaonensis]
MPPLPHRNSRSLGKALCRWRRLNWIKQIDLAERLGISQPALSRFEAGATELDPRAQSLVIDLLSARPASVADRALCRLVAGSQNPVHLICDLSHRLLAASPARLAQWRSSLAELEGRSLWPFASPSIINAEADLPSLGWFEESTSQIEFQTDAFSCPELSIPQGKVRWTRITLATGGHARLVEQMAPH